MTTKLAAPAVSDPNTREARPFAWLSSATALSPTAIRGLPDLRYMTEDSFAALARSLADFSLRIQRPLDLVSAHRAPIVSIRNRRRRAATLWVVAILAGRCDKSTLRSLANSWLPQLAGTGPDVVAAAGSGRKLIEFLRGLMTANLFDRSAANLVPQARALAALDGILAVHLDAVERARRGQPVS
ncbi:MAG: hypothetical protein KDB80_07015 [Planctomycetes bacterium]|nr:hypothetical protein [Planctomycetota bacterium]